MFINQNKHTNHTFFMKLALAQAQKNLGNTKKNPSVGCVITKNNSIISIGFTSINGRPHAEQNAIYLSKTNLKNSELTCRIDGLKNRSPSRIILDNKLKISLNSKIIKEASIYRTIIFYNRFCTG